jgi:hypothetical protein
MQSSFSILNFINIFADLPSFTTLFREISADMGSTDIWGIVILACLMLTLHGVAVLAIAAAFHELDQRLKNKRVYGANFLSVDSNTKCNTV